MRTIQMTIDEPLLLEVDQVIQQLKTTRSEFIRAALKLALQQHMILNLEQKHEQGYRKHPQQASDLTEWEAEQHWGDE